MTSKDKGEVYAKIHAGHRERVKFSVDRDPDFETFNEHEVLEYLLFFVIPRKDTNPIAHLLIERFGSLSGVMHATPEELLQIPDMTANAARLLPCIIPAARQAEISRMKNSVIVDNVSHAIEYLNQFFVNRTAELFYMASLDINDRVIQIDLIARGDTSAVQFNTKTIVAHACRNDASKVLLAHNHPSGGLEPSAFDITATYNLVAALASIGIILTDHMIFNSDGFFSFFNNGIIFDAYEKYDKLMGTDYVKNHSQRRKYTVGMTEYIFDKKNGNYSLTKVSDDSYTSYFDKKPD